MEYIELSVVMYVFAWEGCGGHLYQYCVDAVSALKVHVML